MNELIKMRNVDCIDFSEWNYDINISHGADMVTQVGREVFDCVEFSAFICESRSTPLELTITMPMNDDTYQVDGVPNMIVDFKGAVVEHIDCLIDFSLDGEGDDGYREKYANDVESIKNELIDLVKIANDALNKIKGVTANNG